MFGWIEYSKTIHLPWDSNHSSSLLKNKRLKNNISQSAKIVQWHSINDLSHPFFFLFLSSVVCLGCLVSPWLPSGCQGFSFPRKDRLSRKRGSTGSRGGEKKKLHQDSGLTQLLFYFLFVDLLFVFQEMWQITASLNIWGGPPLLLLIPPCLPVCH